MLEKTLVGSAAALRFPAAAYSFSSYAAATAFTANHIFSEQQYAFIAWQYFMQFACRQ